MIPQGVQVFVALEPVDMRYSFDRLSGIAKEQVGYDARSGALFVFFGRRRDALKVLFFDGSGMCIFYKRLDSGTFQLPEPAAEGARHVEVDDATLEALLDGIAGGRRASGALAAVPRRALKLDVAQGAIEVSASLHDRGSTRISRRDYKRRRARERDLRPASSSSLVSRTSKPRWRRRTTLAQVTAERDKLRRAYEQLKEQLELLRRRIYVAKAERIDATQLEMEFAQTQAKLDALATELDDDARRRRPRPTRRATLPTRRPPPRRAQADGPSRPGPPRTCPRSAWRSSTPRSRARRAHRLRGELQGELSSRRSGARGRRPSDLQDRDRRRRRRPRREAHVQAGHRPEAQGAVPARACSRPR